jgi:tRNA U55 pseudouridine synthase TruB
VGHLTELRRVASGGFTVEEAAPLDAGADVLGARLIALGTAARKALPAVTLTEAGAREARFGRRVPREEMTGDVREGVASAWLDEAGALVAIGRVEGDGRVLRGFAPGERSGAGAGAGAE